VGSENVRVGPRLRLPNPLAEELLACLRHPYPTALVWIHQRTAGLSGNLDMVLTELLDLPVEWPREPPTSETIPAS